MLAKLQGQRYIPTDKEEAFSQLWQLAEDHRTKINDILELVDATASTAQIIDMIKPLAREAFVYQLPVTFNKDNNGLSARIGTSYASITARELEDAWKQAYQDYYIEFTFVSDSLTAIDIWTTAAKTLKLFGRTFSYTGDNLTSIVTTRISDGATLTKTITYAADDNMATLTAVVA